MGRVKRPEVNLTNMHEYSSTYSEQLDKETDRGVVLLGAAYLDIVLVEAIRESLVDDKGEVNALLGPNGATNTFSERIRLAYLIGIIGVNMRDDLETIREIRNAFAHLLHPISFTDQDIDQRVKAMKTLPDWLGPASTQKDHLMKPRTRFILAVAFLITEIHKRAIRASHIARGKDIELNKAEFDAMVREEAAKERNIPPR